MMESHRGPLHLQSTSSCDDDAVNQRLSMSLMRLKFQDRNEIGEEIHGVRSLAREETPELIDESLKKMDEELERIISSPRRDYQHAFESARYLPETFVNDREFRLKFLRCDLFDPVKAADRMIAYLDYLLHLFGWRAMTEPLNSGFFDEKEAAALREGGMQLLPFRDRSGRRVLITLSKGMCLKPVTRCKIAIYLLHTCAEDVDNQRKGMVGLLWLGSDTNLVNNIIIPGGLGSHKSSHKRVIVQSGKTMEEALPMRLVAMHWWLPDTPFFRVMKSFYTFSGPVRYLSRYRFNFGTKTEMKYKLLGYGIPVSHIPETENGVIKNKNHMQWLKVRKLIENDPVACANICECPGMNDVLFRRAGSCMAHPGNSLFKDIIESMKDEHEKANQTEKRLITLTIVDSIERRNGRFFKWSTNRTCWVQMTDRSEIRLKVAMSIRDFNRQAKASQNQQSTRSSTSIFEADYENKRKRKNIESCIFQSPRQAPSPSLSV